MKQLLVNIPEYWQIPEDQRPQSFEEFMERLNRKGGFWKVVSEDIEMWCENTITDNGAISLWKNTINASAGGIAVANIMCISQTVGFTTLNQSIANGASPTSIAVNGLTGPTIPSGSTLLIGAGTGVTCTVTTTQAITGAGTFTCTTVTAANGAINVGANIQVIPPTTDVSSIASPVAYTAALPSSQFSFSGSGTLNRQVQITNSGNYVFSTIANSNPTTAPAANYTDAWLVNTNPVSSTTQTFIHVTFPAPVAVNSTSTGLITIVEKI
jgi:hypothetical protein